MPDDAAAKLDKISSYYPEQMKIEIYHYWDVERRYVESYNDSHKSLIIRGQIMPSFRRLDKVSQFRLFDDIAFLDEAGEWFYDAKDAILYYIPIEGETIENVTAVFPTAKQLVIIKGEEGDKVQNISFQNISFQNTRYTISRKGDASWKSLAEYDPKRAALFDETVDYYENNVPNIW